MTPIEFKEKHGNGQVTTTMTGKKKPLGKLGSQQVQQDPAITGTKDRAEKDRDAAARPRR